MTHFEDDDLYSEIETPEPYQHEYDGSNYAKQVTAEMREIAERSRAPKEETEAYVTLYFATRDDKLKFLKACGIPITEEFYVNGYEFSQAVGRPVERTANLRTVKSTKMEEKRHARKPPRKPR
jgi:hypothetical protein